MRYPGGRNVLKPWMRLGCPAKSSDTLLITPGVSILALVSKESSTQCHLQHSRLTLEILHNIQEAVINVGLVVKLNLHLIEICQGILYYMSVTRTPGGGNQLSLHNSFFFPFFGPFFEPYVAPHDVRKVGDQHYLSKDYE